MKMDCSKATLSKSILDMKFMRRTKEKVEKQMLEKEGEMYFENKLTSKMKDLSDRFIMQPSYAFCEQLIEGRLSFKGMNPAIEKLMEEEEHKKQLEEEKKKETDMSDEQMASEWMVRKGNKKYKYQRINRTEEENSQPPQKKPKFLKPSD